MPDRRPIKDVHENCHVNNFVNWLNLTYGSNYSIVEKPDPPDAIIQSHKRTRWIEVSTAYMNDEFAQDVFSFATPGEIHKPISSGPHINMDKKFAESFVRVLQKKLEKDSYLPVKDKYGPGYLIVPVLYPAFNDDTVREMKDYWNKTKIDDRGCFRSIRITYTSLNKYVFYRWPKK